MTKTFNFSFKKLFLYMIFFSLALQSVFSEEMDKWTVAAEKFSLSKGQIKSSVNDGIAETIPKNILEGLNQVLIRNLSDDEQLYRLRYDLRTKRQSLFLQLSGEYKKRDSLFLSYSGKKLKTKLEEQNQKIKDIEKQIDDNINQLREAEKYEKEKLNRPENQNLPSLINNDKAVVKSEEIVLYKDDSDILYEISPEDKKAGLDSVVFGNKIYEDKVNALITGNITIYDRYIYVSADLYSYPGAKIIGTAADIGSVNDLDIIVSSIVRQLIPLLTNSMPVNIKLKINPEEIKNGYKLYIDDILQKIDGEDLIINSGVHTFKIDADGYESLSTSYFFEGNVQYDIEVNLEKLKEGTVNICLKVPLSGDIFANGQRTKKVDDKKSQIIINGTEVLGNFISENGNISFFQIPPELYSDGSYVSINPKIEDKNANIEKRRKWMYGAYSAFVVSLIPSFIVKGNFLNKAELFYDGVINYNEAKAWQITSNIFTGISIGLGIFWGVELVRYLLAANSVLPEKAKPVNLLDLENDSELQIVENKIDKEDENIEENESAEKDENVEEEHKKDNINQIENKSNNDINGVE